MPNFKKWYRETERVAAVAAAKHRKEHLYYFEERRQRSGDRLGYYVGNTIPPLFLEERVTYGRVES
jgi:hypothetical protein